jgi:diguanylate cyclase (GGDEF)-like protein/PAS domain S-box-containing protein
MALQDKAGVSSLICVPLMRAGKPVAALIVVRLADSNRLGEAEAQTLELVAVVLAAAVSRAAESRARRLEVEALARFEATYSSAPVGMTMIALDGKIIDVNPAMRAMLGTADDELPGRPIASFAHPEDEAALTAQLHRIASADLETIRLEHRLVRPDGEIVWVDAAWSVVRNADGQRSFSIGTVQDITQRKAAEAVVLKQSQLNAHQALHDSLTGLPNRVLFRDRTVRALEAARRANSQVAVLILDLDGFKKINDSLGHAAGDDVLIALSARLHTVLRAADTAARLGGDEFALVLPDAGSRDDVLSVIERVRSEFRRPVAAQGSMVSIDVSIGVAVFPADGPDLDGLVHAADLAMYGAKRDSAGYALAGGATKTLI